MERLIRKYRKEFKKFEKQRKEIKRLWNISEATGKFLFRLFEIAMPKKILELGTSNGYSTFWLSIASEKYGGTVHTIEVDDGRFELAKHNLENRKNVILHKGLIEKIIPRLEEKFDMIFIDANKSDYINYIKLLIEQNKLNDPCLVVADNVISHKESVKDFIDFITKDKRFYTKIENIGSGMSLSVYEIED